MGRTVPVLMHVDRTAKAEAERILSAYNMTLSEAFGLFLRQIAAEEGIPFDTALQDMVSCEAMESMLHGTEPSFRDNLTEDPSGWDSPLYMPLSGSTVQDPKTAQGADSSDDWPEVRS